MVQAKVKIELWSCALNIEKLSLIRHCFLHPAETFQHFVPKIAKRLQAKNKSYGFETYPAWLKENLPKKEIAVPKDAARVNHSDVILPLVTKSYTWTSGCDWNCDSQDPEDIEALHRWGWVKPTNLDLLKDWVSVFDKQMPAPKSKIKPPLIWEAYNISQRIVEYCELKRKGHDVSMLDSHISRSCYYLTTNMECFESGFGNHLLNNLRALYMAGVSLKDESLCRYSKLNIVHVLMELVHQGQLREGSTHYQLLILKWLKELSLYAETDLKDYLTSVIEQMEVTVSRLAAVGFPLFGDISPDIEPSRLKSELTPVFENLDGPYWHSLVEGPHKILTRAEIGDKPNMNHSHNDALHFTYSFGQTELLVDAGRPNYLAESNWALEASAHNSIIVNGNSIKPDQSHRVPPLYRRCRTQVAVTPRGLQLSADGLKRHGINTVTRDLELKNDSLVMIDTVEYDKSVNIRLAFHFPKERNLKLNGQNIQIDSNFALNFITQPTKLELIPPETNTLRRSLKYGSSEGLWTVRAEFRTNPVMTELKKCAE
jgi:hypothetical protein